MADARSMLKASREARKIKHPHASYTSDGKLLCNLCETSIKTESAWQGHLHSTQHTLRLSRAQDAATRGENGASRKRKASTLDTTDNENTKKAKPTTFAPGVEEEQREENPESKDDETAPALSQQNGHDMSKPVDDAAAEPQDLDAFEKELQAMEASMKQSNTQAEVTISAAPMTAEQIAAQAREEQSAQRGKRDAELEAEKEDAARILEDEFDEMEGLEERARKLREKREALREVTTTTEDKDDKPASTNVAEADEGGGGEDEDDDDDDEDFDDWNFGAR